MIDALLEKLKERLTAIERNHSYISSLIDRRNTNEKLLQLEVMRIVSLMPDVSDYLPEKPYDSTGSPKCDFWFKTLDHTEHWMEIKMRPTSYRLGFSKTSHSKAVPNAIRDIIEDINTLKRRTPKDAKRHMLFAFFPMYPESYAKFNKTHLPKIAEVTGRQVNSASTSIQAKDSNFDIYLIELP